MGIIRTDIPFDDMAGAADEVHRAQMSHLIELDYEQPYTVERTPGGILVYCWFDRNLGHIGGLEIHNTDGRAEIHWIDPPLVKPDMSNPDWVKTKQEIENSRRDAHSQMAKYFDSWLQHALARKLGDKWRAPRAEPSQDAQGQNGKRAAQTFVTTPDRFATWLERNTTPRTFTKDSWRLALRGARRTPSGQSVIIEGVESYLIEREGKLPAIQSKGFFPRVYISFTLTPLDSERTDIAIFARDEVPMIREYSDELRAAIEQVFKSGEIGQTAKPSQAAQEDKQTKAKSKRISGPRGDTLPDCKTAMEEWLDKGKPLRLAAELVSRDDQTILKNIPNVLDLVSPQKREEWITRIKALGKEKYLSKH